jgi:ferric-dicitrate binding protein FerR (iron transport regulator)
MAQADLMEQEAELISKLDSSEKTPVIPMAASRQKQKWTSNRMLRGTVAAVSLILLGLIAFWMFNQRPESGARIFTTALGERMNIQLPDGTLVDLNAGSTIRTGPGFGFSSRDIHLEGEAFFDVRHNARIPFIVHTAAMDIKAIGTSFDVRAYADEKVTETALIMGMVEVTLKENDNRKLLLRPNHKITWKKAADRIDSSPAVLAPDSVDAQDGIPKKIAPTDHGEIKEIAWKENKLVFDNELFGDIATLLERWYGVHVEFNDEEVRQYRFTGIFEKEDLNDVLSFLKESRPFNFKIENNETVTVYLSK